MCTVVWILELKHSGVSSLYSYKPNTLSKFLYLIIEIYFDMLFNITLFSSCIQKLTKESIKDRIVSFKHSNDFTESSCNFKKKYPHITQK